jgi:alkylation response protein AidB-like acyl-CoA dehydrogenase
VTSAGTWEVDPFVQQPPQPGNRWRRDAALRLAVRRLVTECDEGGDDVAEAAATWLDSVGEVAADDLVPLARAAEADPPRHRPYDAWGRRVDAIDVDPAWTTLVARGQQLGLVALPYERPFGPASRVAQAAALQLVDPVSATAMCPLSMTDACAALLLRHDPGLAASWVPALTARTGAWTAGQWMTEKEGGSDVGRSATTATDRGDGTYALRGTKWFTSATTADVAVALARPEGAGDGSSGLSLFALRLRDDHGAWNGIRVRRLKDKLGTRALPTAELDLDGAVAVPVGGLGRGVPKVAAVLQVARLWAAQSGPGATGHLLALARDYAQVRQVSDGMLAASPLHQAWLAELAASYEAMLQLSLRAAQLVGADESAPGRDVSPLTRVVLPLAKLACSRQGFDSVGQLVESFGGAGYCEDTGIPQTLRDVLVHCIWEGTGSVLALDVVRALGDPGVGDALLGEIQSQLGRRPGPVAGAGEAAVRSVLPGLRAMVGAPDPSRARDLAWSLARTYQLALVVAHARWAVAVASDGRPAAAADLLAARPLLAPGRRGLDDDALRDLALGAG